MVTILKIAIRNLREHRSKTLIIGIIIAVGVAILVVGNSLMDTVGAGIKKTFISNFTGNVFVHGISDKGKVNLFFVEAPGQQVETPTIPRYDDIVEHVKTLPFIRRSASQITAFATLSLEGVTAEEQVFSMLFGTEGEPYHELFTNTRIVEGRYLREGEEGIVLPRQRMERLEKVYERDLSVGDPILLNGFGSVGFKIREVTIVGVYEALQESDSNSVISYVDAQTARVLKGLNVTLTGDVNLTIEETGLLEADVEGGGEDLFSDDLFGGEMISESTAGQISEDSLFAVLQELDTEQEDASETDEEPLLAGQQSGVWEYLLLQLTRETWTGLIIARLNSYFAAEGIQARADDWKTAAGPFSTSADVVRVVFNAAVFLVAVVAVLIIMNTLVISVIERTGEIGTMRALGSQRMFIRRLFTLEILFITLIFGMVGIALGGAILGVISLIGFKATNAFLEILFAGPVLRPVVSWQSVLLTQAGVLVLGVLANLYPLRLAMKVQPVQAMQAG